MMSSKGDDDAPPPPSLSTPNHPHPHPRPPVPSQLSSDLPGTTTYLTGHSDAGGGSGQAQAVVHSARPASWKAFDGGAMGFNQIYTNRFPADLNGNGDIAYHDAMVGGGAMGLATKGGVVCRMVDMAPLYECMSKYIPEQSSFAAPPSLLGWDVRVSSSNYRSCLLSSGAACSGEKRNERGAGEGPPEP